MTKTKHKVRLLSDAEEARIQAGIAADPNNPEWTARDFRRARPVRQGIPRAGEKLACTCGQAKVGWKIT